MTFHPDDPRLTAYVLGELSGEERRDVEAHLEQCEESRKFVEETRALVGELAQDFGSEPVPALTSDQRRVVDERIDGLERGSSDVAARRVRLLRPPALLALAASVLVATVFAVRSWDGGEEATREVPASMETVAKSEALAERAGLSAEVSFELGEEPTADGKAYVSSNDSYVRDEFVQADGNRVATATPRVTPEMAARPLPETRALFSKTAAPSLPAANGSPAGPVVFGNSLDPSMRGRLKDLRYLAGRETKTVLESEAEGGQTALRLLARGASRIVRAETNATNLSGPGGVGPNKEAFQPVRMDRVVLASDEAAKQDFSTEIVLGKMLGIRKKPTSVLETLGYVEDEAGSTDNLVHDFSAGFFFETEAYSKIEDKPFVTVEAEAVSTFSIDVDTASYSNVRRFLENGRMPPPDAVRIEEMINYFSFDDPAPVGDEPFAVHVEVGECPWRPENRLARIGIKGRIVSKDECPPANLVFLVDVSGSMQSANKLPLLKQGLKRLTDVLEPRDRVAIVVYAGAAGVALPSTGGGRREEIKHALDRLSAGGSTNGGAGIELAYRVAQDKFIDGGINRVVLCTDGDLNVGVTSEGDLVRLIEEKAKTGVFLTVLGFGTGNYKDSALEKIADHGNGNYAYIDTIREADKVLVQGLTGTLLTIAKDVKIQVEFNRLEVESYRLIGYENRRLATEDFNDDKKDAGEIGAGHSVTALYEIVPKGMLSSIAKRPPADKLRYQLPADPSAAAYSGEMMTVKLRYKEPDGDKSKLIAMAVQDGGGDLAMASQEFRFASAVAAFGMVLRHGPSPMKDAPATSVRGRRSTAETREANRGNATFGSIAEMAVNCIKGAVEPEERYRRSEFVELVRKAAQIRDKNAKKDQE